MTDTLFDITPDEPQRKKAHRPAAKASEVAPSPHALPVKCQNRAIKAIGQIDAEPCRGTAFGEPCGTTLRDIYYEDQGEWLVGCWVCGAMSWMPVVHGHLPERSTFVVRGGRFDGLTFDQIIQQPRGLDTIKLYAKNEKNATLCKASRKWLDENPSFA